jgi:hypothetical protein
LVALCATGAPQARTSVADQSRRFKRDVGMTASPQ